jgi:hypothetical protein
MSRTICTRVDGIDGRRFLKRALEDAYRAKNVPPPQFRTLGFADSVRLG